MALAVVSHQSFKERRIILMIILRKNTRQAQHTLTRVSINYFTILLRAFPPPNPSFSLFKIIHFKQEHTHNENCLIIAHNYNYNFLSKLCHSTFGLIVIVDFNVECIFFAMIIS